LLIKQVTKKAAPSAMLPYYGEYKKPVSKGREMVRGIFFDVHGTLIDKGGLHEVEKAITNVVSFLNYNGTSITDEKYKKIWLLNLQKHRRDYEELNEVSFYNWYKGILDDIGLVNPDETWIDQLNEAWMKGFAESTTEIPPAKEVLSKIKPFYRLGIISNSLGRNTELDLIRTSLIEFFDALIISSEMGKRKPHPDIFLAGLKALGLRPEESIMIGDNLEEDIIGAKKVGMKTIYLTQKDISIPLVQSGKAHQFSDELSANHKENELLEFADGVLESLDGLCDLIADW
jgi:putative hydrolase of the HAD superfamily